MALIKTPYAVQPAFNELEVIKDSKLGIGDSATSLKVSEVTPGLGRSVTLHRVVKNGTATFDLRHFVSKLFYDRRISISTTNKYGWAFRDYNLYCSYAIEGQGEFVALNAVQRKGETLNLANYGESALLTHRPIENNRMRIPKYQGFPVGVSLSYKNKYGADFSNAVIVTLQAVAGEEVRAPFTSGGGYIFWGDGEYSSAPVTVVAADAARHTYAISGMYEIKWIPQQEGGIIGLSYTTSVYQTFFTRVRTIEQISDWITGFYCYSWSGLTAVNAVLPAKRSGVEYVTVMHNAFRGCSNLTYINGNFLRAWTQISNAQYMFYGCTKLTSISDGFFSYCPLIQDVSYMFSYSGIKTISGNIFAGQTGLGAIRNCFAYSALTMAPAGLFAKAAGYAESYQEIFIGCSALNSVSGTVFGDGSIPIRATTLKYCFNRCSSLPSVPGTLFKGFTSVTNMEGLFAGSALTSVGSGIFDDLTAATTINNLFDGCSSLPSVPTGIFYKMTNVTSIQYLFNNCTAFNITDANMFYYWTKVTSFSYTFSECKGITSIPATLFDGNTAAALFNSTFQLTGITSIPSELFSKCLAVTSMSGTFNQCTALTTIGANLFANNKNITSFNSCFQGTSPGSITSATPTTAEGYKLWERAGKAGYPATVMGASCFRNQTLIPEYTSIPEDWK